MPASAGFFLPAICPCLRKLHDGYLLVAAGLSTLDLLSPKGDEIT